MTYGLWIGLGSLAVFAGIVAVIYLTPAKQ